VSDSVIADQCSVHPTEEDMMSPSMSDSDFGFLSDADRVLAETEGLTQDINEQVPQILEEIEHSASEAKELAFPDDPSSSSVLPPGGSSFFIESSGTHDALFGFLHSVESDVSKLRDPLTSEAEAAAIDSRASHQVHLVEGVNAADGIRNSVNQADQELLWRNATHEAQVNLDSAEIHSNSHAGAAEQYATQGDLEASEKAAAEAKRYAEQMDYYRRMIDIYRGGAG
jgi:hypothetical protein